MTTNATNNETEFEDTTIRVEQGAGIDFAVNLYGPMGDFWQCVGIGVTRAAAIESARKHLVGLAAALAALE